MTALIVIGCIILFFVFILSLKATVTVEYKDEVTLFVKVLFIKIRLLPSKKKKSGPHSMSEKKAEKIKAKLLEKERKKKEKKRQKKAQKLSENHKPKKKKSLSDILDVLGLVKDILTKVVKIFFKHLKVKVARLKIKVATDDAASTAIAYGIISQAAMYLFTVLAPLDGLTLPKERNAEIVCDYLSDEMEIDLKISLSIRVWHVLHMGLGALSTFISHKLKSQNKK